MLRFIPLLASLCALTACVETAPYPLPAPETTGGDANSVPAQACRAAIATTTGRSVADVAVFDVADSVAGVGVLATVTGAEAPWSCQSSPTGVVAGVMYTRSEGAL